ncbi:SSX6, partial [Sigmodon hispidus]
RMSKSFKDISKYFSEEEWAKLTKWQKSTYVYMKRNYIRMTDLGVIVNKPVFMHGKEHIGKGSEEDYVHGFPVKLFGRLHITLFKLEEHCHEAYSKQTEGEFATRRRNIAHQNIRIKGE